MRGLTWIHLSDWHQKGKDFDRQVVRDALLKDIKNRKSINSDLAKIDFIIFSGDISFNGKAEEYQAAKEELFEPLLESCKLATERLFLVPGNHDIDRNEFRWLPADLQKPLESADEVQNLLTDEKGKSRILEPFHAFKCFASSFANQENPEFGSVRRLEIDGKRIALLGINSSWMCGRHKDIENNIDDERHVLVGEPQIYGPIEDNSDADIKIAVLHHPFDWLAKFDRGNVEERLMQGCDFILCGHQHEPDFKVVRGSNGDCVIIPAGACYNRRKAEESRYTNAYNFVHYDLDAKTIVAFLRRWSDKKKEWIADTESCREGRFEASMPIGKGDGFRIQRDPNSIEYHAEQTRQEENPLMESDGLQNKWPQEENKIPFVIFAMTRDEAHNLISESIFSDPNVAPIERIRFDKFKEALKSHNIINWESHYKDHREEWEPHIYSEKTLEDIISEIMLTLNERQRTPRNKIKREDISMDFFSEDQKEREEAQSKIDQSGAVLIVDSISLFHPLLRKSLIKSGIAKNPNVEMLVLSPIDFCRLPPNNLIDNLIRDEMDVATLEYFEIGNSCKLRGTGVGDLRALKRWLLKALSKTISRAEESNIDNNAKAIENRLGLNDKGYSNKGYVDIISRQGSRKDMNQKANITFAGIK